MKNMSPTMHYLFPSNFGEKLFFITKQFAFPFYSSKPFIVLEYNLMRCRIDLGPGSLQRATSCFPFQEQKFLKVEFWMAETGERDACMG